MVRTDVASLVSIDLHAARREYWFRPPAFLRLESMLRDPRDAPALYLLWDVVVAVFPCALALHLGRPSHSVGLAFFVLNYALFLQRFLLTLHYTEHRPLFTAAHGVLNRLAPTLLCALYGVPSGAYHLHHVVMHHVEANGSPWDLSSTETFQRDSVPHFLWYWLRFALLGCVELPLYAWRRNRQGLAVGSAAAMGAYWAAVSLLWRQNHVATLYTLVLPYVVSSLLLMLGNWSQHVFVDPVRPRDPYGMAYNCVACPDNTATYNDGYHVTHHLNSRLHWSEMPARFAETLDAHDKNDALVFQGVGFIDVGLAVFAGRLAWLVERHIVPCGPTQAARSSEEWVQLLRRRLQPLSCK